MPDRSSSRAVKAEASELTAFRFGPHAQLVHLSRIIESCHDAIFSVDLEQKILSWNPAAERIYGYTTAEMVGADVRCILRSTSQDEFGAVLKRLANGEQLDNYESKRIRKDGREIDVIVTVSPVRDDSGALIGASIIARDITERKRVEAELQTKQRELEDFFENAEVGLHWVGPDGMIIWANRAEMESLGYSPDEYIGHHIAEFHADAPVIEDILQRLGRNEKLHGYEARLKCKDGSLKHVLITSSVLWENGNFVHTRCFTVDVTERKLAEEVLRRTEKMAATGRLAASIAHEINNPLAAVTNLLYLAKRDAEKPSVSHYLDMAEAEVKRVSEIAKRTLGFFKENKFPRPLDLADLVQDVLSVFRPRIEGSGIHVTCECKPTVIQGLEGEMRQVISNLVLNAADASSPGSGITVRVYPVAGNAIITVADSGTGIARNAYCRMFEPFFTTKRDTGTGLGLWVSKEIVTRHGGKIRFRSSDQQHTWTVFRVTLPMSAADEAEAA